MGDTDQKKRKSRISTYTGNKKKFGTGALGPNQRGFLVTCNLNEKKALIECYNILNSIIKSDNEPDNSSVNVDDDLKRELAELKADRPFKQVMTDVKNVLFIKLNRPEHNPIEMMNKLFATIQTDQSIKCRFISKMIPIMKTTDVSKTNILDCLERILKDNTDVEANYKIEICSRNNNKIKRDEFVPKIADLVSEIKPNWKVNLTNPDKLIYIDIVHFVAGVTILEDFFGRNKYNLFLFCARFNDEQDDDQNEAVEGDQNDVKDNSNVEQVSKNEISDSNQTENLVKTDLKVDNKSDDVETKNDDIKNLDA